jgi:hypothetical protein
MREFVKSFVREREGIWICVRPVTLTLAQGRIQVAPGTRFTRGSTFMDVEPAKLLDEHYAAQDRARSIEVPRELVPRRYGR